MRFDAPVLIAGAGIGGACLAIALHRRGIPARVFEAAPGIRPADAGILLAPNALEVLARLDLVSAVASRGIWLDQLGVREFGVLDPRGRMLLPGFALDELRRRYGHGLLALARAELHTALIGALPAEALALNKRVAAVEQGDDGARVTFADGSAASGPIVVGVDGLRSAVRAQVFGGPQPVYSGQTSHRALVDVDWRSLEPPVAAEVWGAALRFGYTPVSASRVYWYSTMLAPAGERDQSPEQARARLRELAADMPAKVRLLIERTPDAALLRTDISDLPAMPSWHAGRVVLLGDAAHATTPNLGQGGCQAIEDAFVLAQCLAERSSPQHAFEAYQRTRKPKADRITATSRRIGAAVHLRHGWQRAARDAALRALPRSFGVRQAEFIYQLNF